MNRDQAYTLVRQTFTQGFDKARFGNFAINLLNRIDESKASAWNNQYVKDAFKDHVSRYERLGTYTSPSPDNEKLDVLIVHLTREFKLERARTAIRNFVADHLKTRDEKDAALVAFVSPTEKQWRFSYVKMEYAAVEKESGKVGVETRLTPARRFSYIVGEGESCHTAQTRFLGLLQDTQTAPKLEAIEEAFSVEAVTKEFFKQYAELFGDIHKALEKLVEKDKTIRNEFQTKNVSTVDFAKKLMGQIVFLYFLQKKGWLGVAKGQDWGTGPHDFLRRLANGEYGKYDNFFNDLLEPLFYDTLATDRGHEAWCNRFKCRIPFLNGGLFEPLGSYDWRETDILLPNQLFTNVDFVEEGITGTGVLDVFDRYNFTVNEAEPLEKEVAIDPEMLGKVFENLIEENRRKGLGAYYTPREIVHYMCQESLINYLDTAVNKVAQASSLRTTDEHDDRATIFFDPDAPQEISERNLPHWRQSGTTYYVTFRLADSMPQEKLQQLTLEREAWLKSHPEPRSPSVTAEYHRLFSEKVEQWLDAGAGSCVLRQPDAAKIVADALKHFDGERYRLGEWVVMPNHVHVLVTPLHKHELSDILHSWKSFTANKINEHFHRTGTLWQHESYDHIVRSDDQLHRIEQYIRDNPTKAGINVTQASSLQNHKQDACATLIPQKDIETFVHLGDQAAHYEAARMSGTKSYKPELPKSIETHARFIDEKLADITVCDPAVGSGAFPVGMMTEIVRARSALTPYFNDVHERTPYHFKRHAIQNCLYGVDIDPGAVEIAKLRLWLSLVVDEEDVKQIKPLPNLDYKVVAGNSLLGVERNIFNNNLFLQLEKLKPQYFDESDTNRKASLKRQIDGLIYQLTTDNEIFDFEIYFSEVFHKPRGFAIVIANPPYIFARESAKKGLTNEDKKYFYEHYELAEYQVNLYPLFVEKATRLLRPSGCLCFITPNNWLTINTNKTMRKFILGQSDITLVNFYARVFESADVDSSIIIFNKYTDSQRVRLFEYTNGLHFIKEADCGFFLKQREYVINIEAFKGGGTSDLMQKIETKSLRLGGIADVKVGLKAYQVGKGKPFQTKEIKESRVFHAERKVADSYFKYLDGKDVSRYSLNWSGEYLKYGDHLAEPRRDFRLFSSERILVRQIPSKPPYCIHACLTKEIALNDLNSMNIINICEKPEYVLGVLNSRLISWWFVHKFGKMQRETFPQFKVNELADFPLPRNGEKHRDEIAKLAGQILAVKKRDPKADTHVVEREIDRLVYKLYDLTPDEINRVEESRRK